MPAPQRGRQGLIRNRFSGWCRRTPVETGLNDRLHGGGEAIAKPGWRIKQIPPTGWINGNCSGSRPKAGGHLRVIGGRRLARGRGSRGVDDRHERVAQEDATQRVERVQSILPGRGDIVADTAEVHEGVEVAERTGDLLPQFHHPQIALRGIRLAGRRSSLSAADIPHESSTNANFLLLRSEGGVIYASVTGGPMMGLPEQLRSTLDLRRKMGPRRACSCRFGTPCAWRNE